jgi:Fic family protein
MNLKLEKEFSKAPILQEVDSLKKQIDDMRPLPEDVEGKVMQKLRLDWNYHSNAIEGNRLSYGETVAFLMEGITAKGKPLKDHLDIRGHNEAINFLLSIVKDTRPITETNIRELHNMILVEPYDVKAQTADGLATKKRITLGEYKKLPNHVKTATGETHYYATPEETPAKMQEMMEWYNKVTESTDIHAVVAAALFHHKFVSIHPFDDGNGRLSRILMNLILMQKGFPPVVIKMDDRTNYYSLLSRADNGDGWPFIEYIIDGLISSLQLYLKAATGGEIAEDDDIDKEISLFQFELESRVAIKRKRSHDQVKYIISESIIPFVKKVLNKTVEFEKYFFINEQRLIITFSDGIEESIELSGHGFISSFIDAVKNSSKDIKSLCIYFRFNRFKEKGNGFNVEFKIHSDFDDTEYTLRNDQTIIIVKPYTEILSISDINYILMFIVQYLKSLIQSNFKK